MRIAVSTGDTKILPSPMLPVLAAPATTSVTLSTKWSGTTTSILIFGRKSTVYSPPRYSSVWPFCRPKPRTSDTVMPITPMPVSASLTSSSLNGLMIASIFFITVLPIADVRATDVPRLHGHKRAISDDWATPAGPRLPKSRAVTGRLLSLRATKRCGRLGAALRDVVLAHLRIERGTAQAQQRGRGLLVPASGLERLEDGRALDLLAARDEHGALERVLELADVARP